jgi:hypothetical protein
MEPILDHEKLDVYGLQLQFVAWTTDFLIEAFAIASPRTGESSLISLIEPACPFCSIPPKEMENVTAFREPNSSMMLAAPHYNVRPAWTPLSPSQWQRAIEPILVSSYCSGS